MDIEMFERLKGEAKSLVRVLVVVGSVLGLQTAAEDPQQHPASNLEVRLEERVIAVQQAVKDLREEMRMWHNPMPAPHPQSIVR